MGKKINPNSLANLKPPFEKGHPVLPGAGRPKLSEEVKQARQDARELLKEKAYWMAERIIELSGNEDPDVAIKALKVGIDKVLPNLEELETHDERPLPEFRESDLTARLEIIQANYKRSGGSDPSQGTPVAI